MKTPPRCRQLDADEMRSRGYDAGAIDGVEYVRALDDEPLLSAARNDAGTAHAAIVVYMSRDGSWTNPSWVTAQCAEEAYERGLIDEQELDWICR